MTQRREVREAQLNLIVTPYGQPGLQELVSSLRELVEALRELTVTPATRVVVAGGRVVAIPPEYIPLGNPVRIEISPTEVKSFDLEEECEYVMVRVMDDDWFIAFNNVSSATEMFPMSAGEYYAFRPPTRRVYLASKTRPTYAHVQQFKLGGR